MMLTYPLFLSFQGPFPSLHDTLSFVSFCLALDDDTHQIYIRWTMESPKAWRLKGRCEKRATLFLLFETL